MQLILNQSFTCIVAIGSCTIDNFRGAYSFGEILQRGKDSECKKVLRGIESAIQFDDVCNIQFTSVSYF
jgi:hypothetical protein